jgi:hypothetical protein
VRGSSALHDLPGQAASSTTLHDEVRVHRSAGGPPMVGLLWIHRAIFWEAHAVEGLA